MNSLSPSLPIFSYSCQDRTSFSTPFSKVCNPISLGSPSSSFPYHSYLSHQAPNDLLLNNPQNLLKLYCIYSIPWSTLIIYCVLKNENILYCILFGTKEPIRSLLLKLLPYCYTSWYSHPWSVCLRLKCSKCSLFAFTKFPTLPNIQQVTHHNRPHQQVFNIIYLQMLFNVFNAFKALPVLMPYHLILE